MISASEIGINATGGEEGTEKHLNFATGMIPREENFNVTIKFNLSF